MIDSKNKWLKDSLKRVEELKLRFDNCSCLVLGNGPSLDQIGRFDLSQYKIIACNNAWRIFKDKELDFDVLFISDRFRALELENETELPDSDIFVGDHDSIVPSPYIYRRIRKRGGFCVKQKLIPFFEKHKMLAKMVSLHGGALSCIAEKKNPATNFVDGLNFGYTVVVPAIQLAVLLGAKEVKLLGVDASSSKGSYFKGMPASLRTDEVFLKNPRLTMEPGLAMLRAFYDVLGVDIIDCSEGALTCLKTGVI